MNRDNPDSLLFLGLSGMAWLGVLLVAADLLAAHPVQVPGLPQPSLPDADELRFQGWALGFAVVTLIGSGLAYLASLPNAALLVWIEQREAAQIAQWSRVGRPASRRAPPKRVVSLVRRLRSTRLVHWWRGQRALSAGRKAREAMA